jgi:PAS domain S-box-containing protein
MLGCRLDEVGATMSEWRQRIHPDDAAMVERRLSDHMSGGTSAFDSEHRIRRADGEYLWVHDRGAAVRSASGRPVRFVGRMSDIQASMRTREMLNRLSLGLAQKHGPEFFKCLVKSFAEVFQVPCAFITECTDSAATRVRTLAFWHGGEYVDNLEYDLVDTPCDLVINLGRVELIPARLAEHYPIEAGFESYLGMPVFDSLGNVVGHIACLDTKAMPADLPIDPIFHLYSVRAGMELERRRMSPDPAV